MSDRPGLSIFDDEPEDETSAGKTGADEATQVIPAVPASEAPRQQQRPAAQGSAQGSGQRPAARPAAAAPQSAPAGPPAAARPTFPVVRRGGYDPSAVDRQIHSLAGEKAGLAASLDDARRRLAALEEELSQARTTLGEHQNPTYAGLGGRASEMLRLAEEQSDDVLAQAKAQAEEVRRRATTDADVV